MLRVLGSVVVIGGLLIALVYGTAGSDGPGSPEAPRATPGDTTWILLNHVKPEQRESFERFVGQILRPALERVAPEDPFYRHLLESTRILYPTRANDDGTYTYVYVMEDYTPGDYSYRRLLRRAYGAEEAEEYLAIPGDALARRQEVYFVVESRSFQEAP